MTIKLWPDGEYYKYLRVDELRQALSTVPEGSLLQTNSVGNLAVYSPTEDDAHTYGEFLGYIDFQYGKFVPADEGGE